MIKASQTLFKPVFKVICDPDLNVLPPDSAIRTEKSNVASEEMLDSSKPKDRVSRQQYSSQFLLNIREKGIFFLPSNLVFSAQKNPNNFNFSKFSPKKLDSSEKNPFSHLTNSDKVENKSLKQKRKLSTVCSKKISPSPECRADTSLSENAQVSEHVSKALSCPKGQSSSRLITNKNSKFLYCNENKHKNEGGGAGQEESILPFQGCKNSEVNKTSGGGKGNALETTSDMESFCLSTVTQVNSLSNGEPNTPLNSCQIPKKVSVVCGNCQNPILGLINDHTYSKDFGEFFQHYKFMKTDSKSDLGKLKIFSLNVGGLKSKLISDE